MAYWKRKSEKVIVTVLIEKSEYFYGKAKKKMENKSLK